MSLQQCLDLWYEIIGVEDKSKLIELDYSSWREEIKLGQSTKDIDRLIEIDPTGSAASLFLQTCLNEFNANTSVSYVQLLNPLSSCHTTLDKIRKLSSLLRLPSLEEPRKNFLHLLMRSLEERKLLTPNVSRLLTSKDTLAWLIRDGLISGDSLDIEWIADGPTAKGVDVSMPVYIYRFWDLNVLINSFDSLPQRAVLLAAITPLDKADQPFFVFMLKDGARQGLISDRPIYKHPLEKRMTRRPGRRFAKRIDLHRFPYELLHVEYDSRGDAYVNTCLSDELVLSKNKANVLAHFSEVDPYQMIWIFLVVDYLQTKYIASSPVVEELHYTGSMVQLPNSSSQLDVLRDRIIDLPLLTLEDMEEIDPKMWDIAPTHQNDWMEQRYSWEVDPDSLNLIGKEELDSARQTLDDTFAPIRNVWGESASRSLVSLEVTTLSTERELERDRIWAARFNQAVYVDRAARTEYDALVDQIIEWYSDHVRKNTPQLIRAACEGRLLAPDQVWETFGASANHKTGNILLVQPAADAWGHTVNITTPTTKDKILCALNGTSASFCFSFRPTTAEALAILAGVKVEQLPEVLRYWTRNERYTGNCILDRLDPMEWVATNPWRKQKFEVGLYLSKRAFNKACTDYNLLHRKSFWKNSEENSG